MEKNKLYGLRKKDFIPVKGLLKYHKRTRSDPVGDLVFDPNEEMKIQNREFLLQLYNLAIIMPTTIYVVRGIESFFS